MLAEIDYGLIVSSITTVLLAIISGYFALKGQQFQSEQKKQGEQITETKHIVNSKNDALTARIDELQTALQVMAGDKAVLVEQARDKSGDVKAAGGEK